MWTECALLSIHSSAWTKANYCVLGIPYAAHLGAVEAKQNKPPVKLQLPEGTRRRFPGQRPHAPTLEITTRLEIEHATETVAQRTPRADFGAPKAPRNAPGVPLRAWNSPNQAKVAPERAGPRFPTTSWQCLGYT